MEDSLAALDLPETIELFEALTPTVEHELEQQLIKARAEGIPAFLSAFMAKSGGTFLYDSLIAAGAVSVEHSIANPIDLERAYLTPKRLQLFLKGGTACHSHMRPTAWNRRALAEGGVKRLWVHVRDPRQAALSSYYHIIGHGQDEEWKRNEAAAREFRMQYNSGPDLSDFPMDDQVRAQFTWRTEWIRQWVEAREHLPCDLLFTSHKEMVSDRPGFEARVLRFFDAPRMAGVFSTDRSGSRFRSGKTNEWKGVFPRETQDWMAERIPSHIAKEFGWPL